MSVNMNDSKFSVNVAFEQSQNFNQNLILIKFDLNVYGHIYFIYVLNSLITVLNLFTQLHIEIPHVIRLANL